MQDCQPFLALQQCNLAFAYTADQGASGYGNHEVRKKGDQVVKTVDPEGIQWGDEEKIPGKKVQQGCKYQGTSA